MSNFTFLETRWDDLARLGELSEKYVYSDPNTSVIKQGMLAEIMVKYMLAYDGIKEPKHDNTHASRIRILREMNYCRTRLTTHYIFCAKTVTMRLITGQKKERKR